MRTFVQKGLVVMLGCVAALAAGCADTQKPASDPRPQPSSFNDPQVQQPMDPIANNHNPSQPAINDPKPQTATISPGNPQEAVNDPQPQKPFYGPGTTSTKDQALAKTAKPLSDAEVLGVAVAANDGEVTMAEMALKKANGADVKQFAGMMKTHHTQGLQKTKTLADKSKLGTSESDLSAALKSEVESAVKDMRDKDGKAFDRAYMDTQVRAHKDVLTAIDNRLVPSAQNGEVKTMLTEMRRVVADHLSKAEAIQKKMDPTASVKGQGAATVGLGLPQPREPKDPGNAKDVDTNDKARDKAREEKGQKPEPRP